jgi:hypothetical protein
MSDTEKKLNFEPLKAGFMEHLTLRNLAPLTGTVPVVVEN